MNNLFYIIFQVWYQFRDDFTDIGWLTITAYGAKGLSANECYCVFKLANDRLQTHTESKTNNPNWMKMLTLLVIRFFLFL